MISHESIEGTMSQQAGYSFWVDRCLEFHRLPNQGVQMYHNVWPRTAAPTGTRAAREVSRVGPMSWDSGLCLVNVVVLGADSEASGDFVTHVNVAVNTELWNEVHMAAKVAGYTVADARREDPNYVLQRWCLLPHTTFYRSNGARPIPRQYLKKLGKDLLAVARCRFVLQRNALNAEAQWSVGVQMLDFFHVRVAKHQTHAVRPQLRQDLATCLLDITDLPQLNKRLIEGTWTTSTESCNMAAVQYFSYNMQPGQIVQLQRVSCTPGVLRDECADANGVAVAVRSLHGEVLGMLPRKNAAKFLWELERGTLFLTAQILPGGTQYIVPMELHVHAACLDGQGDAELPLGFPLNPLNHIACIPAKHSDEAVQPDTPTANMDDGASSDFEDIDIWADVFSSRVQQPPSPSASAEDEDFLAAEEYLRRMEDGSVQDLLETGSVLSVHTEMSRETELSEGSTHTDAKCGHLLSLRGAQPPSVATLKLLEEATLRAQRSGAPWGGTLGAHKAPEDDGWVRKGSIVWGGDGNDEAGSVGSSSVASIRLLSSKSLGKVRFARTPRAPLRELGTEPDATCLQRLP